MAPTETGNYYHKIMNFYSRNYTKDLMLNYFDYVSQEVWRFKQPAKCAHCVNYDFTIFVDHQSFKANISTQNEVVNMCALTLADLKHQLLFKCICQKVLYNITPNRAKSKLGRSLELQHQ